MITTPRSPMWRRLVFLLLACLLGGVHKCGCLRDVRLKVPEAVRRGDNVKLVCDYDLERGSLYSIKWYKGDDEFYRYVPNDMPHTRVFALPGVNVDVSRSGAGAVVLRDVQRELTSFYKCEVSEDAPLFQTDIKSAFMLVADLPKEHEPSWGDVPQDVPFIITEKLRYSLDEPIAANCTSAASFPAANLTWFINGMQVVSSNSWITETPSLYGTLETTVSELRVPRPVFRAGRLTLRCRASLYSLYQRVTDVTLSLEEPHDESPWPPASVRHHDAAETSSAGGGVRRSSGLMVLIFVTSLVLLLTSPHWTTRSSDEKR